MCNISRMNFKHIKAWDSSTCLVLINFNFRFDFKHLWEGGAGNADLERIFRWEDELRDFPSQWKVCHKCKRLKKTRTEKGKGQRHFWFSIEKLCSHMQLRSHCSVFFFFKECSWKRGCHVYLSEVILISLFSLFIRT